MAKLSETQLDVLIRAYDFLIHLANSDDSKKTVAKTTYLLTATNSLKME